MKIFIIGGSSGIGLALAKKYLSLGNKVGICGTNEKKLENLKKSGLEVYRVDVRNKIELKRAIDNFSEGNLDLIINSAGIYTNNRTRKLNEQENLAMIDINMTGVINTFEVVREAMLKNKKGHIAIISSQAGLLDYPNAPLYTKTKKTIIEIVEVYRDFFRENNIYLTTIIPGFIATDKLKSLNKEDITNKFSVLSEDEASNIIIKAIDEKREKIIFPKSLKFLISFLNILPKKLLVLILKMEENYMKKKLTPDDERVI